MMFPLQFERMTLWASANRGSGWFPEIYYFNSTVLSHVSRRDVLCRTISICKHLSWSVELKGAKLIILPCWGCSFTPSLPPCNLFITGGDTSWMTSNMDYLGHHCLRRQLDKIQYWDRSWQSFSFHCMPVLKWEEKVKIFDKLFISAMEPVQYNNEEAKTWVTTNNNGTSVRNLVQVR